ncbi:MAG: hypothetical protein ACJ8CB_09065 [Ktedonobacteraceae bacterium]
MSSRKSSKPSPGDASDHLQLATIVLDALTLPHHSPFYHYLNIASSQIIDHSNFAAQHGLALDSETEYAK